MLLTYKYFAPKERFKIFVKIAVRNQHQNEFDLKTVNNQPNP